MVGLSLSIGNPRYFPIFLPLLIPNLRDMVSFRPVGQLFERIHYLALFIVCTKDTQKFCIVFEIASQFAYLVVAKRIMSFAYRRWDGGGPLGDVLIVFHFFVSTNRSICLDKNFIHKMNMYRDIRSPRRIPLDGAKK